MAKKLKNRKSLFWLRKSFFVVVLKSPFFGKLLLIFLIVLLAYFQTFGMYFWNDDNAVIFKLQHLNEGVGNLGSGIFGFDSPYRMVIFTLIPVFYFFGINSTAFFAYGIFFYFLAAISVYFFATSFFKNSKLALLASLFFASGLVGAESLWRVYNSVHTSITIIYMLLFSAFYNYFIAQKNIKRKIFFYILSLLFYILAIQWGYVRAHGIIIIVIAQELLFNSKRKYSIFRLAPFLYFSYIWYFAGSPNTKYLSLLVSKIFVNYEFGILLIPIQTLKNALISDTFNFPLILFIPVLAFLIFKYRSRLLIFSLVFAVSCYLTYFMIYQDAVLNTTHRYLTVSLPGLSLFWVYVFSGIFKTDKKLFIASGIFIIVNLILINKIQYEILINRSIPTKNFYSQLKYEVPILRKNSVIYFDVKKEADSSNLFDSFFGVGSMPNSTAVAIYYGLDRYDIYLPQTFDELTKTINDKQISKDNIYTFFYSKDNGLKNTTQIFKNSLWSNVGNVINFKNPENINYQFASPLRINLSVKPVVKKEKVFTEKISNLDLYLKYFESKKDYYSSVKITSDTYWQNHTIDKIDDRDYSSSWMGNRGSWNDLHKESLVIDLGKPVMVGAVRLNFGPQDKTPTKYQYLCSLDNINFLDWKTIYFDPKQHAEEKVDILEPKQCRFVKINIEDTKGGDSPEIAEIEVIENNFADLNFKDSQKYESNLALMLNSQYQDLVSGYLSKNGLEITICFITDDFDNLTDQVKSTNCQKKIARIGEQNQFELIVPQSGTLLKKVIILPQVNLGFETGEISGREIKFKEFGKIY